jgi:CubicO group peptidase (beta-lactamase class C family)
MKALMLAVILFVGASLQAQSNPLDSWMDNYIGSLPPGQHFRGNILVERDGRVILERGYGFAVEGWKVPNTRESRFEIASLSKQFTAASILQLEEAGKLSIQDPVSKYYAQSPAAWRAITIEELLTHTSGIPNNDLTDYTKGLAACYSTEDLIGTFRDKPLAFSPGTKWAYTNTEYYLLAYIIEKVSGESYRDYLTEHIFKPLGMSHSEFASSLTVILNMTEGYSSQDGKLSLREYYDRSLETGAGGITSTAGDLLIWNHALSKPGFLSAQSLEAMFTVHPPGHYGFGWFVQEKPVRLIWHEGGDPGFATFEARYPDQRLLIVVLANEDDAPVKQISEAIANRLGNGK